MAAASGIVDEGHDQNQKTSEVLPHISSDGNEKLDVLPPEVRLPGFGQQQGESWHTTLPEMFKLLGASLFVAIVLHKWIFGDTSVRKNRAIGSGSVLGTGEAPGAPAAEDAARSRNYGRLVTSSFSAQRSNHDKYDGKSNQNYDSDKNPNLFKSPVQPEDVTASINERTNHSDYDKPPETALPKGGTPNASSESSASSKDVSSSSLSLASSPDSSSARPSSSPAPAPAPSDKSENSSSNILHLHSQAKHPGLEAYYNWQASSTSLYRVYAYSSFASNTGIPSGANSTFRDYQEAILPMQPSSERGFMPLHLEVSNRSNLFRNIDVFWIDFKGNEVYKGTIGHDEIWTQTTYIGHPWTFRATPATTDDNGVNDASIVILKYVPFRIIPSIVGVETVYMGDVSSPHLASSSGNIMAKQKFTIFDIPHGTVDRYTGRTPACFVQDTILPEVPLIPSSSFAAGNTTVPSNNQTRVDANFNPWAGISLNDSRLSQQQHQQPELTQRDQISQAVQFSCHQIQREDVVYPGKGTNCARLLLKLLRNICHNPDQPKYRKLRVGNQIFKEGVYNVGGGRGVLFALGFEEHFGHLEMGPGEGINSNRDSSQSGNRRMRPDAGGNNSETRAMLSYERIKQVSDAMVTINKTLKIMEEGEDHAGGGDIVSAAPVATLTQPDGVDGYGRAGFGHAGGLNL